LVLSAVSRILKQMVLLLRWWNFSCNEMRLSAAPESVKLYEICLEGLEPHYTKKRFTIEADRLLSLSPWFKKFVQAIEDTDLATQNELLSTISLPPRTEPHPKITQPGTSRQLILLNGLDDNGFAFVHAYTALGRVPEPEGVVPRPWQSEGHAAVGVVDAYVLAGVFGLPELQTLLIKLLKDVFLHHWGLVKRLPEDEYLRWFRVLPASGQPILDLLARNMARQVWITASKRNPKSARPLNLIPLHRPHEPFQRYKRLFMLPRFKSTFELAMRRIVVGAHGITDNLGKLPDYLPTPISSPMSSRRSRKLRHRREYWTEKGIVEY